jgi:hypothetical protein
VARKPAIALFSKPYCLQLLVAIVSHTLQHRGSRFSQIAADHTYRACVKGCLCCYKMSAVSEVPEHLPLLTLPDPCLLAVLQCCAAEDQRSLCSAARAHSRLHKAAALALSSIDVTVRQQQQLDSVLLYLDKHGSQQLEAVTAPRIGLRPKPCPASLALHPAAAQL